MENYYKDFGLKESCEIENKLIEFCKKYKEIFLYGAGIYGLEYLNILKKNNINIIGFITSNRLISEYYGFPVYTLSEIKLILTKEQGIVLAVKEEFQREILMQKYMFNRSNLFFMKNIDFAKLRSKIFFEKIDCLEKDFPVEKNFDSDAWKRILIVRLDAIGDLIWTTAFFRELKNNFPLSKITLVIRSQNKILVEKCPYIDKIILYDCSLYAGRFSNDMDNRAQVFAENYLKDKYDVVFLPRPIPRTLEDAIENVLVSIYSGAKNRIARADFVQDEERFLYEALKPLFSRIKKHKTPKHEVTRILELIKICGGNVSNDKMELWLGEEDKIFAKRSLKLKRNLLETNIVYVAVGLFSNDKNREWDINKYKKLIEKLHCKYRNKIVFVLLGKSAEPNIKYIIKDQDMVINLIDNTNLSQVAAIINECDMYMGANTGLLHMASAFNKPVLEISAHLSAGKDTDGIAPLRTGAWRVKSYVIKPLVGLDDCKVFCKKTYAHCINQISVEDVQIILMDMIKDFLKKKCR